MTGYTYIGSELELFSQAVHWKSYLLSQIAPHLGDEVLEVGAGIGATTGALCKRNHRGWLCLEPDATLAGQLRGALDAGKLPKCCSLKIGTTQDIEPNRQFDSVIYIDVLEHIEDDAGELRRAATLLKPGGRLVVLCPAHQSLYTAFDKAIGHFRRYNKKMMAAAGPPSLEQVQLNYLDSVGLLASGANKMLLRQGMPTVGQVRLWDRVMVRLSRVVDPLVGHRMGKSILAVWQSPRR
jgi:SAM-dependent methyltransferase